MAVLTSRAFLLGVVISATAPSLASAECPDLLRGVGVALQQVEGGMAFTFTTPRTSEVGELRHMLRMSAALVEAHSQESSPGTEEMSDFSTIELLPVDIEIDDMGAGARVTVRAERTADTRELRRQSRKFELVWARSSCGPAAQPIAAPSTRKVGRPRATAATARR